MLLSNDLRILLVEDNLVVVDSVLRLLSKLGYNKVESVTDYNAAVQILSQKKIHLLLIDIFLSGTETGIELGGYIRKNRNIPFIFMSAKTKHEDIRRGMDLGANDYITKPFHPPMVKARVKLHLNLKRKQELLEKYV